MPAVVGIGGRVMMAQQLRAFTVLTEDMGLVLSTDEVAHSHPYFSSGDLMSSSEVFRYEAHMWNIYIHAGKTPLCIIFMYVLLEGQE